MLNISGYDTGADLDYADQERELLVNSCGRYRLQSLPQWRTNRPQGRRDYQLLYVHSGRAYFERDGGMRTAESGTAVFYRPLEPQNYWYCLEDKPDVYWLHFTGRGAEALLAELGFTGFGPYAVLSRSRYEELFGRMIRELQVQGPAYRQLASACARELLGIMCRTLAGGEEKDNPCMARMYALMEKMNRNPREEKSVRELAQELNMSEAWFRRCFETAAGMPPLKYLTRLRMQKARELLENSFCTVSEVSYLAGYDDPLYFSRIFKKWVGISPREYRHHISKDKS